MNSNEPNVDESSSSTRGPTDGPSASVEPEAASATAPPLSALLAVRAAIAGVLMGIANLIPGVSGGTMILAMGLYEEFIDSVAALTSLRFTLRRIVFLGIVGTGAVSAILGLSGVILYLLFHYTIAMFALFIGLTLGGAPLLYRALRPLRADAVVAILVGLGLMIGVIAAKRGAAFPHNTGMDFVSGLVGSTTMVLPGISGSYMLLVMDQYERVVGAVDSLKDGLRGGDRSLLTDSLRIVIPVGIAAVAGIVGLSNLLKWLLRRYHRATVGVLLGILLGSVIGLWPFAKAPSTDALERRSLAELQIFAEAWAIPDTEGFAGDHAAFAQRVFERWPERGVSPYQIRSILQAALMVVVGFAATFALSRVGQSRTSSGSPTE